MSNWNAGTWWRVCKDKTQVNWTWYRNYKSSLQAAGKSLHWLGAWGELPQYGSYSFAKHQLEGQMLSHDLGLHTITRRELCLLVFAQMSLCSLRFVLPLEPLRLLIDLRQDHPWSGVGAYAGIFLCLIECSSLDDQGMRSKCWNQGLCQLGEAMRQHNGNLPVWVVHAVKHSPSTWTQTAEWEISSTLRRLTWK